MLMKIEKIKKSGSKYRLTLDNGEVITTFDDVILENNLLFDKHIDSELLNKIKTDTVYYESYNKAINMISRRLRSEYEIRKYLEKNMTIDEDIDKIICTLKRIGLINDKVFAKAYTNDKINLSLDGPDKIARNLANFKIDEDIIHEVINNIDRNIIEELLEKIINKKAKANTKYSEYRFKQKIKNYLINQGYDISLINQKLADIHFDNDIAIKEMDKIYNKLASKYTDEELLFKLKNKLYTKGYKIEEINNFLDQKTVH